MSKSTPTKLTKFSDRLRPQILLALASVILLLVAFFSSSAPSALADSARQLVAPAGNNGSLKIKGLVVKPDKHGTVSKPKPRPKPMLALSFDDGPNPLTTPLILNTLEKENVKASFFIVGSRVAGNEKILRRMYHDGYDIGNHSWNHPDFVNLNEKQIASQIIRTEKVIAAAGVPAPFMFRPPYGDLGDHFPGKMPLAIVLWNIDPRDWADHDVKTLTKEILSQAKPGGIVDMHGIYLATAEAVAKAIPKLKKHYRLVTVSKLLGIEPGATGKFYGHYK